MVHEHGESEGWCVERSTYVARDLLLECMLACVCVTYNANKEVFDIVPEVVAKAVVSE